MTTCIGCCCDEGHACTRDLPDGSLDMCHWIAVGPAGLAGVCSACHDIFDADSVAAMLVEAEADLDEADLREQRGGLVLPGDSDFGL